MSLTMRSIVAAVVVCAWAPSTGAQQPPPAQANGGMQPGGMHQGMTGRGSTTIETTAKGVVVTQTSNNPQAVAALQQHASEVSAFVRMAWRRCAPR